MSLDGRVIGLVQARDSWPLLAVSVEHALTRHVDEVHVLLHASRDRALDGLRRLGSRWGSRLTVVTCGQAGFWQEAMTNTLIQTCGARPEDWIYVFDADEFLLTPSGDGLRAALRAVEDEVEVIRYPVRNWVSRSDFDESRLEDYAGIRHRAVVSQFMALSEDLYEDEIAAGNLSFFDLPFPSKVVVRGRLDCWLMAGAHGVRAAGRVAERSLVDDGAPAIIAEHLPLPSRRCLELKAAQGRRLIADGFPAHQGWQNQMLARAAGRGELDAFWARHSLPADPATADPSLAVEPDASLAEALEPILGALEADWAGCVRPPLAAAGRGAGDDTAVPFSTAVRTARRLQSWTESERRRSAQIEDALRADREAAVAEWSAARSELQAALRRSDGLAEELDALHGECQALAAQRDLLVEERDAALAERDAALVECRRLDETVRQALGSRAWRWAEHARRLRRRLARPRRGVPRGAGGRAPEAPPPPIVARVAAEGITYLEQEALLMLHREMERIEREGAPGQVIEAGCALGGSAVVIAHAKDPARPMVVYDAFGMIPAPGEEDGEDVHARYSVIASGRATGLRGGVYYGYRSDLVGEVGETFARHGVPVEECSVTLVEGLFEETLHPSGPVALAHVDADWYSSVATCLERIWPHLADGGLIVVDDYDAWSGCRRAVDEFVAGHDDVVMERDVRVRLRRARRRAG